MVTVETLWEWFEGMLADPAGRCPCGCSWDGGRWLLAAAPDTMVWEHTSQGWETALCNHWIHFAAGWCHDGRNPFGARDGTWVDRPTLRGALRPKVVTGP